MWEPESVHTIAFITTIAGIAVSRPRIAPCLLCSSLRVLTS
jgi:hypothetical protein